MHGKLGWPDGRAAVNAGDETYCWIVFVYKVILNCLTTWAARVLSERERDQISVRSSAYSGAIH